MHSSETAIKEFATKVKSYYGKEYHPEQGNMIARWFLANTKDHELDGVYRTLTETYAFRGSMPLIHDFAQALEKYRATQPRQTPVYQVTAKEKAEAEKVMAKVSKGWEAVDKPLEVPSDIAGEVTLADYTNFQKEFDMVLIHEALSRFCGSDCKSTIKGYHYHKKYNEEFRTWYFYLKKCDAWKN